MPTEAIPVPLGEDRREPTQLDQISGQLLRNVHSWNGRIQKFGGLSRLGGTSQTLTQPPRNFFEAIFPEGTRQLLALSVSINGTFQYWNGTVWSANLSGAGGRITTPGPSNVRYSIVNTLGQVYIAAGGNNNLIVYDTTIAPPGDLVFLTGHGVSGVTNLSCRVILGFGDRLVLVRTVEDGVDKPNRIRWNALSAGPVGGFNTALSGSGSREITESTSEPLTGGFVLGERAFLTKAHEILELIPNEDPAVVFAIESRVSGTGLIAPFSVAVAENIAFFIGSDNVYAFDGSQLKAIGDPVLDDLCNLFTARGNDQLRPQGVIHPRRGQYWLLPYTTAHTIYVYDYLRNRWFEQDMEVPVTGEQGPITIGFVSGSLYSGSTETQTVVMNGSDTAQKTAFILDETVNTRTDYSTNTAEFTCLVQTKQGFTKRKGARGVVEPVAVDRLNVLWEVTFKGAPSASVTVTATDAGGTSETQTVTTDAGGRGKAFFNFPWQCGDLTFSNTGTGSFQLRGVVGYRWSEGGIQLPTDPL